MNTPIFGSRWVRGIQRWGIGRLRRSRFFPVTIPDRLGDDDRLAGQPIPHRVLVYFPDTQESLYQLLPWLPAFEALDERLRVVVVCQDSRTAGRIRAASKLDVLTIARYGRLDDVLSRSNVGLALYVNHSSRNFDCLRFTSMNHVYLGHGDSDKGVSASNQVKAYDYCFVAGQGAVDRIAAHVRNYDAQERCIKTGQPQLDTSGLLTLPERVGGQRPVVLYAPTWEGAQPSVAYSSVLTHGEALAGAILDDGGYDLVYRPHPLTGVTSGEYGAADARIRELIMKAGAGHRVDAAGTLTDAFAHSDLLICDVSAVALNWLATRKPLMVTQPPAATGYTPEERFATVVPQLSAREAGNVIVELNELRRTWNSGGGLAELVTYYFTSAVPGGATQLFIEACEEHAITMRQSGRGEHGPTGHGE